jgi:hypothetical protein
MGMLLCMSTAFRSGTLVSEPWHQSVNYIVANTCIGDLNSLMRSSGLACDPRRTELLRCAGRGDYDTLHPDVAVQCQSQDVNRTAASSLGCFN